jgi:hypothetical protein
MLLIFILIALGGLVVYGVKYVGEKIVLGCCGIYNFISTKVTNFYYGETNQASFTTTEQQQKFDNSASYFIISAATYVAYSII